VGWSNAYCPGSRVDDKYPAVPDLARNWHFRFSRCRAARQDQDKLIATAGELEDVRLLPVQWDAGVQGNRAQAGTIRIEPVDRRQGW
jgi:hypothetical protein